MPPRPAERCCFGCCELSTAVQLLACFATVQGIFAFVGIIAGPARKLSGPELALYFMESITRLIGLFCGLSAYFGVMLGDARRVMLLFFYYVLSMLVLLIEYMVKLAYICEIVQQHWDEQKTPKDKRIGCSQLRLIETMATVMQWSLLTWFAYVVGSYVHQLTQDDGMDDGAELADLNLLRNDAGDSGGGGQGINALLRAMQPVQPANEPSVQPFVGTPYQMEQGPATAQPPPFGGTPYRLGPS